MGEALINGFSAGLSAVITFVPKLLGFLLILLIGWLIAKGLSKLVELVLSKIGFRNLLERAGLQDLMARTNLDVAGLIVKIVYYFVLLIALQFAFSAFGPNPVEQLLSTIITFLPRVIVAIILIVVAAAIAKILRELVESALVGRSYAPLLGKITYGIILALGIMAAVNQIGVATTITTPILIAVLATAGGILVVGAGGGLIGPMRQRWERWLAALGEQGGASRAAEPAQAPQAAQPPQQNPGGYEGGYEPPA